jgi:hypothetical protein
MAREAAKGWSEGRGRTNGRVRSRIHREPDAVRAEQIVQLLVPDFVNTV